MSIKDSDGSKLNGTGVIVEPGGYGITNSHPADRVRAYVKKCIRD